MNRHSVSVAAASAIALSCTFSLAAHAAERIVLAGTMNDAAAVVAKIAPAAPAPGAPATGAAAARVPACARKVKMVYSGYGEADRASCPSPSVDAMR